MTRIKKVLNVILSLALFSAPLALAVIFLPGEEMNHRTAIAIGALAGAMFLALRHAPKFKSDEEYNDFIRAAGLPPHWRTDYVKPNYPPSF